MNKRFLHHLWTIIRPIKTWYLLVLAVACATICVFALRDNYVTMTNLRADVYAADKANVDVVKALERLRSFVNSHMNTNLADKDGIYPPIHLTYTYERLKRAEQDRVVTTNSKVYTDAQHYCEQQYPGSFSGGPRVPCIEQYVKDHGTSVKPIPDALYKFSFATPRWSSDLAGTMLVLAILFLALTVLRFIVGRLLEYLTR